MNNNIYKEVVYNSPTGYAYLKIVCDEQGSPIDYVFLDVNDSFEKYTGLKASSVLEKRVTEVIPGIKDDEIDWISKYGKVALSEELIEFDQYSTALKRHYRIKAFSPKKGYFITLFSDISAYTKMEQQIGYEQVLVQKYLDTANIMFLVLEHGETIKSINKKGCEILGLEEKDLLGKNWFDNFIPKHLVSQVKNVFVKIINNEIENVEFFENSIITANGDERIISWHNTILRDETGNVISMLSSGNDITDQKNAEKDLMESEEKFKYTFENSPIGKSFTKPSGEINPNKTLCKMLAYTKKELKGIKWLNIIHPDDIEANQKKIDTVLNGGKNSASVITRFIKKNGSILWADVRTSLRRDAEEKPLYFMTNVIDITEQRKSEKSLRQSERRLKAAQNMAKVGNWEIDLETKKMWASEEAYNIYGIQNTAEPISLDFVQSLVLSEYRELLNLKLGNLISKKEKYNIEFKIRSNKTGEVKFVYSKADLELDEKGNAIKVIGTIQDITKRKKMESERESTQSILVNHQKLESIGTLASGVAHEINNPINGILNYGQIILDSDSDDENVKEYASEIINETNRIAEIVKNLLDFSRQNTQEHTYANVADIISNTLSLINTVIKQDQIDLIIDIPEDLPKIKCRSQQIQQVIMNLLTNSRDALNEKYEGYNKDKVIKLSCSQFTKENHRWIRIIVEDHGIGIKKSTQSNIFNPFFSTKGRDKGTGLGLSISYGIVKDHLGELTFETEEGIYTKFYLDLQVDNGWGIKN